MNQIKALCDKYGMSHRQLGLLTGYHRDTIQKINTGIYNITPHLAILLAHIERELKNGDVKIPK